jgi:hypothetical protein
MLYTVILLLSLLASSTLVSSLQCYSCEGGFILNYTVTNNTVPSFSKCKVINGGICWFTVLWDRNTNQSSILVDNIDARSTNYDVEHIIMASADMYVTKQHEIPQVNHSFSYVYL